MHTSVFSNWQHWLVCSGVADRGLCFHKFHHPSKQCSTSVPHPGVHLHFFLQQKAWVCCTHQSWWIMYWDSIQHNLAWIYYCNKWSCWCKVCLWLNEWCIYIVHCVYRSYLFATHISVMLHCEQFCCLLDLYDVFCLAMHLYKYSPVYAVCHHFCTPNKDHIGGNIGCVH